MNISIKIILSILLFVCLADMPYDYYQFVRFIAFICFVFFAHDAKQNNGLKEMVIYGVLALLFQPFIKIALGRQLWNIIDIVIGVGLILSMHKRQKAV